MEIDIHQVDLVDSNFVAFEAVGGAIGQAAANQHQDRKTDPGQFQPLEKAAQNEVVKGTDHDDVNEHEERDQAIRDHRNVRKLFQVVLQRAGQVHGFLRRVLASRDLSRGVRVRAWNVEQLVPELRLGRPVSERRLIDVESNEGHLPEATGGPDHQWTDVPAFLLR